MSRATAAAALGLAFLLVFCASASAGTGPTITYSIDGIAGSNGWYRGSAHGDNVVLHWTVSPDATSSDCLAAVTVPGPTSGTTESCTATNGVDRTTVTTTIKIDATPPAGVTASLSRGPDFHGWYNHPVAINWTGTDSTSGIAGCSSVTYQGPDSSAATVSGGCTDVAGNTATSTVQLPYDATGPVLHDVAVSSAANADVVRWKSTSAGDRIVVHRTARGSSGRSTIFNRSGANVADKKIRPGVEYEYSVQAFDQAGNASRAVSVLALPKVLTMQKMHYVPRAASKPILRWNRAAGASYYNVQLFRGSKLVFSAWPAAHQLGLPTSWRWEGHRYRLGPGRYRWYVWAGLGARTLAHYRAVGSATFIVPRG
jgi:hypothetical protein